MSQKTVGYCWSTYFHATQSLVRLRILHVPGPSITAYARHRLRHFGVDQQYPVVFRDNIRSQSPCNAHYKLCKRSQGYHGGTNLAKVERKADRAHIAVGASVVAAQRITSSAWKRMLGGMVRPRAWAVLRLMTSSNLMDCSIGRSPGLAPLRILST